MMFMILGFGLFLLPILFRLALKLRLGVPMLYAPPPSFSGRTFSGYAADCDQRIQEF